MANMQERDLKLNKETLSPSLHNQPKPA